jgi:CheY-like chemotaxis protein
MHWTVRYRTLGKFTVMYHRKMTKKLLLVEDLPHDVLLTRRALLDCGVQHDIAVAADGEEALRYLGDGADFDLILLDIKLQKVDGFEVLKHIAATPSISGIPVVMLSSSDDPSDRVRADVLGASSFVFKAPEYSEYRNSLQGTLAPYGLC